MEELKVYKEILEAIKISQSNLDLESDLENINIDKKILEKKLISDYEIINKAREKVYNDRRE